jgi:primosomal protein N' (replication factor Y)
VARFLARFERVAVLHSGLTAAQRHAQWRRIRRGEANIVVGARSAVFAPVQNLKMIIVDEEHESSYKQDQAPRYHGRDVAVKRAQLWNVPVVLGSATPSLESYYNAGGRMRDPEAANKEEGDNKNAESVAHRPAAQTAAGRSHYHLVRMPQRVAGMAMPTVELVDMQDERRERRGLHMMSQSLERQLTGALDPKQPGGAGQAILLLNRRGYANYIACPDHNCGWMLRCEHCDAAMVYHREKHLPAGGVVRCHHCTAEQRLPKVCPVCEKRVTVFGHGTQRVEEELQRKFPNLTYLRMDSDTMRRSRDYEDTLARFREGEVDVLLGTQMIAKGLDFAGVRLVGVISGDTSLHVPDFRASERTFQLISQVSGRAGRSDRPGRVIVQTFSPDDPAITAAANHDYDGFAARELYLRYEMSLPPIQRMARLVVRDMDHQACLTRAQTIADQLRTENDRLGGRVDLHGPVPCPLARLADYYRYQVEMTASTAGALQSLLTALRNARSLVSDMHTAVDVDPVSLL